MKWFPLLCLILILNTKASDQFPSGDYYNPEIPINSGDVFVWDIVNSTFNSGELIMIDQDTPLIDVDLRITVLQDLVVIDAFEVLIDFRTYFTLEYKFDDGTLIAASLDANFTPFRPTYRVRLDGTAVNIFADEFVEQGEIEQGFRYLDRTVITRALTDDEFTKVTEAFNSQNELTHRSEERWDVKRGIRNYFEIKSLITQSHILWILEGYNSNPSENNSGDSGDDSFLNSPQTLFVGIISLVMITWNKRKRTNP